MAKAINCIVYPAAVVTSRVSGASQTDGWQTVATFLAADAPNAPDGARDYTLIITGHICNVASGSGPIQSQECAEVSVWRGGTYSTDEWHRVSLNSIDHDKTAAPNNSHPFVIIVPHSNWTAGESVHVKARMAAYGSNPSFPEYTFEVRELTVLCLDETAFGTSLIQRETFNGPTTINSWNANALRTYSNLAITSAALPWTTGTDYWLVFGTAKFRQGSYTDSTNILFQKESSGAYAWDPSAAWGYQTHGGVSRGRIDYDPNFNVYRNEYWTGIAQVVAVSNGTTKLSIKGIGQYDEAVIAPPGQAKPVFLRGGFVAFKLSAVPGWDYYQPGGAVSHYKASGTTVTREITLAESRRLLVLASATPQGAPNRGGIATSCQFNDGVILPDKFTARAFASIYIPGSGYIEGMPDLRMAKAEAMDGLNRMTYFGRLNPNAPNGTPPYNAGNLCLACCAFETDTSLYPPDVAEVVGPTIYVTVNRETTALGTLSALPIEPSFGYDMRVEVPRVRYRTFNGYEVSWPRFNRPRRTYSVRWNGLSTTQRDTLTTFFRGLGAAAFKWTPPGEPTARAFVLDGPPVQVEDQHPAYDVTATFIELVWIGP